MIRWLKVPLFVLCLAPLAREVWLAFHNGLGANPLEHITHFTGDWTIRFLVITLAVSPFRKLFNASSLIRFRRMFGLFAFFYGTLHFATYLWFDKAFEWPEIVKDIGKRPFITVGFLGLMCMLPLAITSTAGWIRRLGGRRWQLLHRLIYVSACAGVVHYYWLVKSDVRKPLMYGAMVGVLLLFRLGAIFLKRRVTARTRVSSPSSAY